MNEMFLLKMGEIVLKGLNRSTFEGKLHSNLNRRLKPYGKFKIRLLQSTVYVEPENEDCDLDGAWEACGRVFGISTRCRSRGCDKDLDAIFQACVDYLGDDIAAAKSFKVESKRADKRFPMTSIQISQEIGGRLAEAYPEVEVDVHDPDYTVYVEVREERAFVHGPSEPGAGGLPIGVGGKTALLLSGGIDSPVAGYMIAKRGVELECVHFFSYPYTSERAKEKVLDLAKIMARYCGRMTVHVVGFTKIQEEIRDKCPEEYFTLIMRRMMMRISEKLAYKLGCMSLTTGESLGQVASQTMQAMLVTNAVCTLPVFRPVVGMDKEEIITIARKIDTMETSILPYEDCCTVFTPRHPKTRPSLSEIEKAEAELDIETLVNEAVEGTEMVHISCGR
jgi:thiamine biosynthesis protein ThiI